MNALQRMMAPMQRRVMLMVGRAVLELVNDNTKVQAAQVSLLEGEVRDQVERFQNYGFTSVPEAGAEGVALSVQGNRDHIILVAVDDRRYRKLGLLPGEVAVYTKWGDYIHIKQGEIEIKHATKVVITSPLVTMSGNLQVAGNITAGGSLNVTGSAAVAGSITATGDVVGAGISLSTHRQSGVTPGGGLSGVPV
ncbi:phage baseplate assembly protein V [Polaromonas sp. JS666]|uniref:phage baseplate assembly protein V n=1 Tax=Polaromonas sp. (strain JS666 / ATCC BAA-500) TaxID=296591 RepID=UPI0000464B68|nr:phage baseplate assembly protein V [Polaromonas sp. JS666]ABE45634.1 Phage-related baseplate assembly protein V [Polaromonas sp. JS666]